MFGFRYFSLNVVSFTHIIWINRLDMAAMWHEKKDRAKIEALGSTKSSTKGQPHTHPHVQTHIQIVRALQGAGVFCGCFHRLVLAVFAMWVFQQSQGMMWVQSRALHFESFWWTYFTPTGCHKEYFLSFGWCGWSCMDGIWMIHLWYSLILILHHAEMIPDESCSFRMIPVTLLVFKSGVESFVISSMLRLLVVCRSLFV